MHCLMGVFRFPFKLGKFRPFCWNLKKLPKFQLHHSKALPKIHPQNFPPQTKLNNSIHVRTSHSSQRRPDNFQSNKFGPLSGLVVWNGHVSTTETKRARRPLSLSLSLNAIWPTLNMHVYRTFIPFFLPPSWCRLNSHFFHLLPSKATCTEQV